MKSIIAATLAVVFFNGFAAGMFFGHHPVAPKGVPVDTDIVYLTYFTQQLDHFNKSDNTTWDQRYYLSTNFYNASTSYAFLNLGGEEEIDIYWMQYGTWIDIAKKYGALAFQLEHRFYGKSQPFEDSSTENLRFLNSKQALADAAHFITEMNEAYKLGDNVKWIVFGGSYSGNLAAWMRLKYPKLVDGAVASSAPVHAIRNFPEYVQVTLDDMNTTDDKCVANLTKAVAQVEKILNGTDTTSNITVSKLFNLCAPIEGLDSDDDNVKSFYNRLAHVFTSIAQNNGLTDTSISDLCAILTDEKKGDEIHRLADVISRVQGKSCLANNYTKNIIAWQYPRNEGGVRQWLYQTCFEFGWFQSSNRIDRAFGIGANVDFQIKMCTDVFGSSFSDDYITKQIAATNEDYLGLNIANNVTNVVFVHGSFDPWYPAGVTKSSNADSPAIFINGSAHCADTYVATQGEPKGVEDARKEITRLVGLWLGSEK